MSAAATATMPRRIAVFGSVAADGGPGPDEHPFSAPARAVLDRVLEAVACGAPAIAGPILDRAVAEGAITRGERHSMLRALSRPGRRRRGARGRGQPGGGAHAARGACRAAPRRSDDRPPDPRRGGRVRAPDPGPGAADPRAAAHEPRSRAALTPHRGDAYADHMSFLADLFKDKTRMIFADSALPGREREMPVPERQFVLGTPLRPRSRRACRPRCSAWAASGAPSGCSGRRRASTPPRSATPAALRRTRPTRRSAAAGPATPRWSSSCSTPADLLRRDAADLLGEPRPDPGHAPGQRCRHPIPLGDLYPGRRAARGSRGSRDGYRRGCRRGLRRRSRPRSPRPAPFYYAEDYHQQYLAKNPDGYCGLGGTGVSCPIGLAAKS